MITPETVAVVRVSLAGAAVEVKDATTAAAELEMLASEAVAAVEIEFTMEAATEEMEAATENALTEAALTDKTEDSDANAEDIDGA